MPRKSGGKKPIRRKSEKKPKGLFEQSYWHGFPFSSFFGRLYPPKRIAVIMGSPACAGWKEAAGLLSARDGAGGHAGFAGGGRAGVKAMK